MLYKSTRSTAEASLTSAEVIKEGLAPDGGLYVPESIPTLTLPEIELLSKQSYPERAADILARFLTDYTHEELSEDCCAAYSREHFVGGVAPLIGLHTEYPMAVLELWHGPTAAFKDMALQIMPKLLSRALKMTGEERKALILVATSGDTGKAALEGYRDVPGVSIEVFYPVDGVSRVQKLQMSTQLGDNVAVCAIKGNFDDAQTGVKKIFGDAAMSELLDKNGVFLSSANSINWGRLVPQIVYYVSAYCDLLRDEKIQPGQAINVCVPTGNFGNILAAYYAREMGVPIGKLICASNSNNVLTDFIKTGVYDRNRTFYNTMSPSMDILISSNLERLLLALTQDVNEVKGYMAQLNETGRYEVSDKVREKLQSLFCGYCCDDAETQKVIGSIYEKNEYLLDPHTAVAFSALAQYRAETGDQAPSVVVSTASPFKFCDSVLGALGEHQIAQGLDALDQLTAKTHLAAPAPLAGLRNKEVRFTRVVEKDHMVDAVLSMLE